MIMVQSRYFPSSEKVNEFPVAMNSNVFHCKVTSPIYLHIFRLTPSIINNFWNLATEAENLFFSGLA